MTKLSDLEKQAEENWIPKPGDVYYWRERSTRRGNIISGIVISFDPQKQIVRGSLANHSTERKYLVDIFHIKQPPFGKVR